MLKLIFDKRTYFAILPCSPGDEYICENCGCNLIENSCSVCSTLKKDNNSLHFICLYDYSLDEVISRTDAFSFYGNYDACLAYILAEKLKNETFKNVPIK
jgi:predicted amidophosphoribosyltransferase